MKGSSAELNDLVQRGYRFALSLTHDSARAEDLVQDAWFAVLKAGGPWTRGYVFAAIRNRFIDHYRRGKLVAMEPLRDHPDEQPGSETQLWPDEEAAYAENGTLGRALGRLRPEERAVLLLSAVEEYTAREIAEFLDWPRGTVLSMVHRARGKLRQLVQDESGSAA